MSAIINEFITLRNDLGEWDIDRINTELQHLLVTNGYVWDAWKSQGQVIKDGKLYPDYGVDLNLTSNNDLCQTLHDRLWKYSGRYYKDATVEHAELSTVLPEIEGTYLAGMIAHFQTIFGPIRVRLHNRVNLVGLYWHIDKNSENRFHLPLWTSPGHFLVWTDQFSTWLPSFDPEDCKKSMKFNAEFIPADGKVRLLATHDIMHGVANIGVGWKNPRLQSRCHLTFWKI